ncbi:MAG: hypothetical protein OXR67_16850 [Chloroflexota bacterium]|nr:hypothetical protein [Chloroflexota bacterium]
MLGTIATGRNIFYRGYVIHEDVPTICYTIYDRRPDRTELATVGTSREAMKWVDSRISIEEKLGDTQVPIRELLALARSVAVL